MPIATFDYSDLNAYLLVVVGLGHPEEGQTAAFDNILKKGQKGETVVLREMLGLSKKEPLVTMSETDNLKKAIKFFGGGIHRIFVCKEGTSEVIGILSQLKVIEFLWDNGPSFPSIDTMYPMMLRDLNFGTQAPIAIK